MIKKISLIGMSILLVIMSVGCSKKEQLVEKTATKMDTIVRIKAYGPNAAKAIDAALIRIDEIEQMASTSIPTSDVSKINQAAGKEYIKVHPEVIKMLTTAVKYSKLSNGAFDISVGPLINLWGIGTQNERIPSDSEIASKLPLVGYNDISINEADSSVKLNRAGMSIDLGGIGKGFTADEVEKVLKNYGVTSALVNLGGSSIYALGQKPDGTPWVIGVQHPRKERNTEMICQVSLSQQALSTSGDYERYFIQDGKRYHHIINPATGYPTDNGIMSDTIVIDSNMPDHNMLADLLTKFVFVSGVDKGLKLIDNTPGVSCIVETTDYKIYKSSAWKLQLDRLSTEFTMAN